MYAYGGASEPTGLNGVNLVRGDADVLISRLNDGQLGRCFRV